MRKKHPLPVCMTGSFFYAFSPADSLISDEFPRPIEIGVLKCYTFQNGISFMRKPIGQ